jgi:phage terminase large subunit-like protein
MSDQEFRVSLHPGQAAIFNSPARFKVVAAGRRFGKSHHAAAMLAIEALRETNAAGYQLTQEHGVYYVAPTFDQAKRIMWPKLRMMLGKAPEGYIVNENVNDGWLELVNGRRIYIRGADNPDSLRGIALSFVVLDEYADMKPNVWHEIIEPALMDVEGSALFIGTPKGKNHFYKLFMGALEKPVSPKTGTNEHWNDWEAFHFKSMDNPFLAEKELKRMMEGDNRPLEVVRQELEASFVSGGGKVLKPDWFEIVEMGRPGAISRPGANALSVMATLDQGSVYITVDLAGFAKEDGNKILRTDESVICETLVVGDNWYVLNVQHGHWDVRETAMRIVRTSARYPSARLGVEAGALKNAVGPYMEEYMREFGRYMTPEPLTHGGTKKADRISWALQGRGERRMIKLVRGDWNDWLLTQISDFPDPLAHDDGIDALAYVDQMAKANYASTADIEEWEPLDLDSGY